MYFRFNRRDDDDSKGDFIGWFITIAGIVIMLLIAWPYLPGVS